MAPRLHAIASKMLSDLELPTMRDLGFTRDMRGRRSQPAPDHLVQAKMEFLWRAAQSGKTRAIQDIIKEDATQSEFLNIVICANIQLQVAQTAERMRRDCYRSSDDDSDSASVSSYDSIVSQDDRIDGDVFTWMSAGPKAKVRELADMIKEDDVRMVVCCSNKPRFRALQELLENLEKSKVFHKTIKVWIDEADASVNLWSTPGFDFTRFTRVSRMCLVSATFNSVVKRYGRIRVLPFETTHPDCYVPLSECDLMTCSGKMDPTLHLTTVLQESPELCKPGVKLFAPALVERATHDDTESVLHKFGFAVLVLNGERKEITLPGSATRIPVKLDFSDPTKPMELSVVLPGILRDNNILAQFPFAVTGQMCLGRGITFQSSEFLFDAGVLPDLPDPAAAYQCVARLLGNIKKARGFKTPTIFLSETMRRVTLAQERIALYIAKAVGDQGWADVGLAEIEHVLSQGKPRGVDPSQHREVGYRAYLTEAEAKAVLAVLEPEYRWRSRSFSKEQPGFYEAAVGGRKDVNSYADTLRTLPNLTGGKGETKTRTMYVPCYLDKKDASTLRYVVPILPTVSAETLAEIDAAWPQI